MSNPPLKPEQVLEQLHWRYATKKFDPSKKIPEAIWKSLEQSLVLSPSSFGLQPWQFFVVRNPEIRQKLLEPGWGQKKIVEASHLVVFAIKKDIDNDYVDHYIERMAEVQQVSSDNLQGFANMVKGYLQDPPFPLEVNKWAAKQAYIALGFFMNCAAMMEVDTAPMEGFIPGKYDEILDLNSKGYSAVVLCAAGYRAEDDKHSSDPKVRFPTNDVVQYVD
ncbi:NAD(P)H-dependent oxidoreductase [Pleurocapsa sp. FMAR1]|uniref:NAD(P)H-dependent oxidoreductase n=1 Tax=Pleurocapsa sp. FMAR1 TaxID=3040204 RepID=UPI0029C8436A|nr:NAD(P)H-dependent oxidoreductase [Pleurocapsa sp. FMAR1]